jgi:predicted LPLAT superfamily acyltransferase
VKAAGARSAPENPQAPDTGPWRRRLGALHYSGVFWYRAMLGGARLLPDFVLAAVVPLAAAVFLVLVGSVRRAAARNLEPFLGPPRGFAGLRRAWRTVHQFAWVLCERYEQFAPAVQFEFAIVGREHWEALTAARRGGILVTAHFGNWELGSTLPATREVLEVHLVREQELDRRSQVLVQGLVRELGGGRYHTHFASDDPSLGVTLLQALRAGQLVALQGDRPRAGGRTATVTLGGRPFELPLGPAALARSAGAPLVPVFTVRTGRRRYELHFAAPIAVPRGADRDADCRGALQAYAAELEAQIRAHPHQWFCFRELWPGQRRG